MTNFLRLCDDCKRAIMRARSEGEILPKLCRACALEFAAPPRPSFSFGQCPSETITLAVKSQCPDGYPMVIKCRSEWKALSEAWNQGIDAYLEAMTERSSADHTTGRVLVHPDELATLLRRLYEDGAEDGWGLRSSILTTLGIEEI